MGNTSASVQQETQSPYFVAVADNRTRSSNTQSTIPAFAKENDTQKVKSQSDVYGHEDSSDQAKSSCCGTNGCLKVIFVILAIITVFASIVLIAIAISTAIATKIYSSDLSGRLAAMIILAVSAAATVSVIIYATIGIFRKSTKLCNAASIALIMLVIIQAVIAGVSVTVTEEDEFTLSRSLIESFRLSKDDNPRYSKIWATTQSDLQCCGVYSPEDYRRPGVPYYFSPDVPISCCLSFDPDRSEVVQERAREVCKARSEYYAVGCKTHVLQIFKDTSHWVLGVTIVLIVLEVAELIVGSVISRVSRKCVEKLSKPKNPEEGSDLTQSIK